MSSVPAFNSYSLGGGAVGGAGFCVLYQGVAVADYRDVALCAGLGLASAYILDMTNAKLMGMSSIIPPAGTTVGMTPVVVGAGYGVLGSLLYAMVMRQ